MSPIGASLEDDSRPVICLVEERFPLALMERTHAYLALNLLPQIGAARTRSLVGRFGSPEAALHAAAADLKAVPGIGGELAALISRWRDHVDLDAELEKIAARQLTIITQEDPSYPRLLLHSPSPPLVLYVWGSLAHQDHNAISVVGSRRTTHYGIETTRKLAFQIARAGMTVVSGLARGIDTAAHEAAIAAGGRTVAVLGSGLGQLYPPENLPLARHITSSGQGAIVSEFPVDYPPDRLSFPLRNRIVAAWGHGTLVVEAPIKSGSLITAKMAADIGRSVYAVPGQINRPTSQGTNYLIQQGARLVVDGSDIVEDLNALATSQEQLSLNLTPHEDRRGNAGKNEKKPLPPLNVKESSVLEAIGDEEPSFDALLASTGLASPALTSALLQLQMKKLVRQLPGMRFTKIH